MQRAKLVPIPLFIIEEQLVAYYCPFCGSRYSSQAGVDSCPCDEEEKEREGVEKKDRS
jgi:hypothetical protein